MQGQSEYKEYFDKIAFDDNTRVKYGEILVTGHESFYLK